MTNKDNQWLVEAISEGLVLKYEDEMSTIEKHPRCSKRHYKKMSEILGFKVKAPRRINKKGMAAILLAAALLLTGCAVFKNEIRDFFVEVYETFVKVTFDNGKDDEQIISETYELTYMLEGYEQTETIVNPAIVRYEYRNSEEHVIIFTQSPLDNTNYRVDAEHSDYTFLTIGEYRVYHRYTEQNNTYIWNDGHYSLYIYSDMALSNADLENLISGIKSIR
jgi:hypothetical protein